MHVANDRFPHRCNSDGTFDSTCTICFATVGNTSTEDELRLLEASHVCDPELMTARELIKA